MKRPDRRDGASEQKATAKGERQGFRSTPCGDRKRVPTCWFGSYVGRAALPTTSEALHEELSRLLDYGPHHCRYAFGYETAQCDSTASVSKRGGVSGTTTRKQLRNDHLGSFATAERKLNAPAPRISLLFGLKVKRRHWLKGVSTIIG